MIAAYILLGLTAAWILFLLVLNLVQLFRIPCLWWKIKAKNLSSDETAIIKRNVLGAVIIAFVAIVFIIVTNA